MFVVFALVVVSELGESEEDNEVEADAGAEESSVAELVLESSVADLKIFASGESAGRFSIAAKRSIHKKILAIIEF